MENWKPVENGLSLVHSSSGDHVNLVTIQCNFATGRNPSLVDSDTDGMLSSIIDE